MPPNDSILDHKPSALDSRHSKMESLPYSTGQLQVIQSRLKDQIEVIKTV